MIDIVTRELWYFMGMIIFGIAVLILSHYITKKTK